MRTIQFRAYDLENDVMRYDVGVTPNGVAEAPWGKEKYEWPLMLFTGLLDKNETMIYESDIVETLDGIAVVVFDSDMAMFGLESPGSRAVDYDLFLVAPKSEVIGNVFDTPEFIE